MPSPIVKQGVALKPKRYATPYRYVVAQREDGLVFSIIKRHPKQPWEASLTETYHVDGGGPVLPMPLVQPTTFVSLPMALQWVAAQL